eukprot:TRINITY_DN328_c0_g1_i1.p1 TRINITY_DN328_c0_g1~~TRINITY_DN328_c0_g1_i1.p1  ORF type:complete len:205 (+),score=45.19 TRINITY_DN328_c0_g1_i1:64-678(+)
MRPMSEIQDVRVTECDESRFIRPQRIHYTQDGKCKVWDICRLHDSISVLIYNRDQDSLVLVKQFRPPVYLSNSNGFTLELCSGLVDKDKTLEEITREEIMEETGYDVPVEQIHRLTSFHSAVGISGCKQTLFHCIVRDAQRISPGGGIEEEKIEVVHLPCAEIERLILDEETARPPNLMFMLQWFVSHKVALIEQHNAQTSLTL